MASAAVDPDFVQAPEHRPKPTGAGAAVGIPLIDLSPLVHSSVPAAGGCATTPAISGLLAEVEAACREWGFFRVINHGVPSELLDDVMAASKGFFELPAEEKRRVKRGKARSLGYDDTEHTKNVRDWKEVFDFIIEDPAVFPVLAEPGADDFSFRNQWPEYPPGFKEACEKYANAAKELAFKLLELIALTLGLPAKRLNEFFKDQSSFIRLNYYPPCPSPHLALGLSRHKDAGALTILAQDDVGGLDVKRRSDGEWIRVKPLPDSFVVNVGDIIQVWSNDKYVSAEHRVRVNSERARFSVPFFFNPAHYVTVQPLEELVDEKNSPAKYNAYNWGEFFMARKKSNFKKPEAESIQIYHFKKAE